MATLKANPAATPAPTKGAAAATPATATVAVANVKVQAATAFNADLDRNAATIAAAFRKFDADTRGTTGYQSAVALASAIGFTDQRAAMWRDDPNNPIEQSIRHAVDLAMPDKGFAAAAMVKQRMQALVNISSDDAVVAARKGFTDAGVAYAGVKDIPAKNLKWNHPGSNETDGSSTDACEAWLASVEDGQEYLDARDNPLAMIRLGKRINAATQYGTRLKQALVLPWIAEVFTTEEAQTNWRAIGTAAWNGLRDAAKKVDGNNPLTPENAKKAAVDAAKKKVGDVVAEGKVARTEEEVRVAAVKALFRAVKSAAEAGVLSAEQRKWLTDAFAEMGIVPPAKSRGATPDASAPAGSEVTDDTDTDEQDATEEQSDGADDAAVLEQEVTDETTEEVTEEVTEEETTEEETTEEVETVEPAPAPAPKRPVPLPNRPPVPRGK